LWVHRIADAIARFERSKVVKRFTSKYDYFLKGLVRLNDRELRGRKTFEDPAKGSCAACHPDRPATDGTPPLVTDFTYGQYRGLPKNPENPIYGMPAAFNPEGFAFVDKGLGNTVHVRSENGKFKTLRGVFNFYNTRDIKPACGNEWVSEEQALSKSCWPTPEESGNVNHDELGALGLSEDEASDLIAFLKTLTDGYRLRR
jgi:cytochrome c peroxidase